MLLQDKIHKDHKDTPAIWSMCWMNFWCSLYNCVYLFGVTSAGWDLLSFCREFPEVQQLLHTSCILLDPAWLLLLKAFALRKPLVLVVLKWEQAAEAEALKD